MTESDLRKTLEDLHEESFGWALSCTRGQHLTAEDVLQTAYVKVLSGRAVFRQESAFKTWLFGVIRRTALELCRKERTRRLLRVREWHTLSTRRSEPSPADAADRSSDALRIRGHAAALPRRQHDVLMLVFYHDLSLSETATTLGISIGSVRRHYERGKANLRDRLRKENAHERPEWVPHPPSREPDERFRSEYAL